MPVQFDEREEETEQRQTGLRRPGENLTNCHREAKATAPLLDSTNNPPWPKPGSARLPQLVSDLHPFQNSWYLAPWHCPSYYSKPWLLSSIS